MFFTVAIIRPHIIEEDLDGDRVDVFARLFPRMIQKYYFGESEVFNEEVAKKEAQSRSHSITYYIVSSNSEQAGYISTLLKSIGARVYLMKGDDFFSKSEGLYSTVGIDRCACLKGSVTIYGAPTLVIDGGTAITYTALDSEGHIMGGGISCGTIMRFNALHDGTELPMIKYEGLLRDYITKAIDEQSPLPIFSRNTEQAMIVATLNEISSSIRNIIKLWLQKVGPGDVDLGDASNPDRTVVVTGGGGDIIAKLLEPACGGILESANDISQKYTVKWENCMIHIGVCSSLLSQIKKNYVNPEEEKEEEHVGTEKKDFDIIHIGKRVAKYFAQAQEDGDHIYRGTINKVSQGKYASYFFVVYDDGDSEEVFLDELYGKRSRILFIFDF